MRRWPHLFAFAVFIIASFHALPAQANIFSTLRDTIFQGRTKNHQEKSEQPSMVKVELPKNKLVAPPPKAAPFPALPPSRKCTRRDLLGLWLLQHVYESPLGPESASYKSNPAQYIIFRPNGIFGRYNAGRNQLPTGTVIQQMSQHATGLMQFVIQGTGFVYVYQDKVAVETQVCFIVTNPRLTFEVGDMLLLPPKGQIQGRLAKQYKRIKKLGIRIPKNKLNAMKPNQNKPQQIPPKNPAMPNPQ